MPGDLLGWIISLASTLCLLHRCDLQLACRLTVYPEVVRAADRWLDSSAGRSSPFAATLRQADGSGYARASPWCPGMASAEDSSAAAESAGPPLERIVLASSMSREESSAVPGEHAHSSPPAPATGVVYRSVWTGLPNA